MFRSAYVAIFAFLLAVGCERPPTADVREWTAADHDRSDSKEKAGAQAPKAAAGSANDKSEDIAIETTWKMVCTPCHGATGRGDGPNGPMVQAADLGDPAYQGRVTDEALATSIKNGKGKMPKFDLPDDMVKKLVAKVRRFKR